MWPFSKHSEAPVCVQMIYLFFICFCVLPLPCVDFDRLWWSKPGWWKWRRMWKRGKSDSNVKEDARRRRCCANDRDEWRQAGRKRDLIPSTTKTQHGNVPKFKSYIKTSHSRQRVGRWLSVFKTGRVRAKTVDDISPFLRLPLEVRELIYGQCIDDWSSVKPNKTLNENLPIPPYEPPISRTSRQIRDESINMFYKAWRFPLILHPTSQIPPFWEFEKVDWYGRLEHQKLSMIRHLKLYLCMRNVAFGCDAIVFDIDLNPFADGVQPQFETQLVNWRDGLSAQEQNVGKLHDKVAMRASQVVVALRRSGNLTPRDVYHLIPSPDELIELPTWQMF